LVSKLDQATLAQNAHISSLRSEFLPPGLASRTALGKCHVDFYDVYFKRQHKKIISFASNGRAVERLVFQSGKKLLEAPFATDGGQSERG
jgi:hypothetical protein